MVAACAALSLATAVGAQSKGNKPKPPASQVAQGSATPVPSPTHVLTEEQKYCRAKNGCSLTGPTCKKCVGK